MGRFLGQLHNMFDKISGGKCHLSFEVNGLILYKLPFGGLFYFVFIFLKPEFAWKVTF